ncbi:MAG: phosphoglycerate kinase [Nanoarchaeota archaeon]|nr:phosphoglycerate kinase [Nanoarchaeota archaeon]
MNRFSLADFPVKYKRVLLRVDYNLPLTENNKVNDNTKIKASLPTIKYLLQQNCKIIIATHLGRPDGKIVPALRTDPLAEELQQLLPNVSITKLNDCIGKEIKQRILQANPKDIFVLENLRFYKEEEKDTLAFAHSLADLAEVYVNDAFAVSHRKQASVHAITRFIPSLAGILVEKEIMYLNKALNPQRPAVWIMGGAKLNKIEFMNNALDKADKILVGGALAFAFLKAQKIPIGMSKTDHDSVTTAAKLLHLKNRGKIILPVDFMVAESISSTAKATAVRYNQLQMNQIGLDLGPETIALFKQHLRPAQTIVWNGPLGYFELAPFSTATKEIGRFIGKLAATTICGGGETVEAIHKFHLGHTMTHISTGGGATLAFLSGKKLPAITALEENYRKFKNSFG